MRIPLAKDSNETRVGKVGRNADISAINHYTGWLKLKYPTGQNAISRQPCEIFIPKFLDIYGRDPATILKFKKKIILVFSKVMAV